MQTPRADLIRRIDQLPPRLRGEALRLLPAALGGAEAQQERHRERARSYVDKHPEKYARELMGDLPWTADQRRLADEVLDILAGHAPSRVAPVGGHGTAKTHAVSRITLWLFDAHGSQLDVEGAYQGAHVIITAPTARSIEGTIYDHLIRGAESAAARGHQVPGFGPRRGYAGASRKSVNWSEGHWKMEALVAKATAGGDIAHSVGGRHHRHRQILLAEEGMGVPEGVWAAYDGLSVAANTLSLAPANPTSRGGHLYAMVKRGGWRVVGFSQLRHPNVLLRQTVIPGGVDHLRLEEALRGVFEDRGPAASTPIDPSLLDVVYALPPLSMPDEPGPRPDGIPGHPRAEPRILRPMSARAAGQHLDAWLEADESALLFHVSKIRSQMARPWTRPTGRPDRVGVDCAPTRPPVACPAWGPTARAALDSKTAEPLITLGAPHEVEWRGYDKLEAARVAARALISAYGTEPEYILDQAFGGEVAQALQAGQDGCRRVELVLFNEAPVATTSIELYAPPANRRAEMATEAAAAFNSSIVAMPHSEKVLEQMEATGALLVDGRRCKVRPKEEIERLLGYSPDELDSVKLALASKKAPVAIGGRRGTSIFD